VENIQQPTPEARLHFLDYWRVIKTRKAIVFVVFLLVILVAATVTYFQPKIYQAAARIKVEQEKMSLPVFEREAYPTYDPYFLQTQYEIIQSQKILYPVIQFFDLQKQWGGSQPLPIDIALRRLKGSMGVRRYRDTSLIEISVESEQPSQAAQLANKIADFFSTERLEVRRKETQRGLDKLQDKLKEQQVKVQAAQQKVERLRRELNVPIFGAVKLSDMTIQQLEQQQTTAKVEMVSRDTRLRELKKLTPPQLRNAAPTVFSDVNLASLLQSLDVTDLQLEKLKQQFGAEHPELRTAVAQREKLQAQIDTRVDGLMRGFEIEVKMAQERYDTLAKQLEDLKKATLTLDSEAFLPYRNAQRDEESETRLYETMKLQFEQETVKLGLPRSPVELIDQAEVPLFPVRPNMVMNLILAGVAGLVLGIALAFFIEFLDTSVKIMEDVERFLGLPVLGVIPQGTAQLSRSDADPGHLESYRMLRTNIDFSQPNTERKSLAVLSVGAGEGKSFTLTNLAFVYAQQGARVLVVDSDLRRPTAHKYLGVDRHNGLSDFLTGNKSIDEIIQATNVANVWLIPAGSPKSSKLALPLLTSQRMNQLIKEVGQRFDMVLYDTPPVLGISDAVIIAREVGNSVLVVQHRRFPRQMSLRARKMVENAGGKLLGVIVNNVHVGHEDTYYYYHDHYEHYLRGVEDAGDEPAKGKDRPVTAATASKSEKIDLEGKY
jgi:capsular exopolysaccharide synthesis family protein